MVTYLRTGRHHKLSRGEVKNHKMDYEIRIRLQLIIDVNPLATLEKIKRDLEGALQQEQPVSLSSILQELDSRFISLKLVKDVPDARNAPRTLDLPMVPGGGDSDPHRILLTRLVITCGHINHMAGHKIVKV